MGLYGASDDIHGDDIKFMVGKQSGDVRHDADALLEIEFQFECQILSSFP
jgi:uncharacterized protein YcfJ